MTYAFKGFRSAESYVFIRTIILLGLLAVLVSTGFGQTCTPSSTPPFVHIDGLAELVGDIKVTCSGGPGGPAINTVVAIVMNATVTNRLDTTGINLTGITLTGPGVLSTAPPTANSPNVVLFSAVSLPSTSPTFTISGIRVAVPTTTGGGSTPLINATVAANQFGIANSPILVATSAPSLLASVFNYGLPCTGSPAPVTNDFPGLVAAGTVSSTVRVTEASASAFAIKSASADNGVRFLVSLSGYTSSSTVYVPDIIVGNGGTAPTSAGQFGPVASGGTYYPGQLLLARVINADSTGVGGTPFLGVAPGAITSFASISQVPLVNGAGSVTYEVIGANASQIETAQIPVFVSVASFNCAATPPANNLSVSMAPVSSVSIPTQTDPIPRFIASAPPSDCGQLGDCSASYFPILRTSTTSITLKGSSQGPVQKDFITVTNGGSNQFTFTVTKTYLTNAGLSSVDWLTLNAASGVVGPSAGVSSFSVVLSGDPTNLLIPGAYQATVTINAGSAGNATIPVTFNVGPAGPIIKAVVNAANAQPGPVTAGSFISIYGINLVPANPPATVVFNGFPATISYDGQPSANGPSQINVLVPFQLAGAANVGVTATIDGVPSNTFPVSLVANAPAVFNPGILNQNNSVNLSSAPASRGDIIQIFLTGLATPVPAGITVNIGTSVITGSSIIYAGPVVSIPGLEQINVQVPAALSFTGNSANLSVCAPGTGSQLTCSASVPLYLQ